MSLERNLQEQLTAFFLNKLQVRVVSPETDLLEAGLLDSLKLVELLLHLENQFGLHISVDDLEMERFRSIASIAQFVHSHFALVPEDHRDRAASHF